MGLYRSLRRVREAIVPGTVRQVAAPNRARPSLLPRRLSEMAKQDRLCFHQNSCELFFMDLEEKLLAEIVNVVRFSSL